MNAFLDVETAWDGSLTVIGVYRSGLGTSQLVSPDMSSRALRDILEGATRIFTYNGSRFDLHVIQTQLGVALSAWLPHHDLMYDCWAHQLYGGLKAVEQRLGIHRDTEGIGGIDAMNLWARYRKGDEEALDILLRYNREDVENLETLAIQLGVIAVEPV